MMNGGTRHERAVFAQWLIDQRSARVTDNPANPEPSPVVQHIDYIDDRVTWYDPPCAAPPVAEPKRSRRRRAADSRVGALPAENGATVDDHCDDGFAGYTDEELAAQKRAAEAFDPEG